MINVEVDDEAIRQELDRLGLRLENFPRKMRDAFAQWQIRDLHRTTPEVDMPNSNTVATRKRPRAARRAYSRFLRRLGRRAVNRLMPRPMRMLRRFARIGRRPERVLLPTPVRRLRALTRQARGISRGRPRPIGRAIRPLGRVMRARRRAYMSANLLQAFTDRMRGLEL